MKSSPIYNIVTNPGRKSDASFGSSSGFTQDIRVGTSSSNSHTLGTITVDFVEREEGREFRLWLDGEIVKTGILDGKEFALAA